MIEYLLIGDGPTDRALLPIIRWAMRRAHPSGTFAAPTFLSRNARPVDHAVAQARDYQPNIVFVHRDAERETREQRLQEVPHAHDVVPVIPVRMTEAWLLIDERAIRTAAGNPNGTSALDLPPRRRLEAMPDPKAALKALLADASGLGQRRRARFDRADAIQRLAEIIEDYSPLRDLPAFQAFYADLVDGLEAIGVPRGELVRG
jgi:Domain of unknown function (DUF4276)